MYSLLFSVSVLTGLVVAAPTSSNPTIKASTGIFTGVVNSTFPNVHAFLDVPYGMSTAGSNRFMPPQAVPPSEQTFDATKYPPACPQYVTGVKNIWNQEIPQYLQYWGVSNLSAGVSAPFATEDCLKLAIWKPANATSASLLPVAMVRSSAAERMQGC
jgi:carboxylesterase type B